LDQRERRSDTPNIIRLIKSRRMRWAGHEWGEEECTWDIGGKPEERRPLERPVHRWGDVKMNLREQIWVIWTVFIWLKIKASGRFL
jgi:hypothetical protein